MSFRAVVGIPGSKHVWHPAFSTLMSPTDALRPGPGVTASWKLSPTPPIQPWSLSPHPGFLLPCWQSPQALQTWPKVTLSLACDSYALAAPRKAPMLRRGDVGKTMTP